MKSFVRRHANKMASSFAAIALLVTALNVNSCCMWISHQAEMPKSAKKLRKF